MFELALDLLLDQRDPERRSARRSKRRAGKPKTTSTHRGSDTRTKRAKATPKPAPVSTGNAHPARQLKEKPKFASTHTERHIAARVRDTVFERDGGRCTYVGPSGRRCKTRHYLQVDHVKPVARGGTSTLDNLRLLCGPHNRIEAERVLGKPCGARRRSGAPDQGVDMNLIESTWPVRLE